MASSSIFRENLPHFPTLSRENPRENEPFSPNPPSKNLIQNIPIYSNHFSSNGSKKKSNSNHFCLYGSSSNPPLENWANGFSQNHNFSDPNQAMHGFQSPKSILLQPLAQNQIYQEVISTEFQSENTEIPNKSSCITAQKKSKRKIQQKKKKCLKAKKPRKANKRSKRSKPSIWTSEEDSVLVDLVEKYGNKRWSCIAKMMNDRIGKQCRERWQNHLRPDIKKNKWEEYEDIILIQAHKEKGNKWAQISQLLPGRPENSIKNRWNATKRKQPSDEPSQKYPYLKNYIKSVTNHPSPQSEVINFQNSSSSAPAPAASEEEITSGDCYVPQFEEASEYHQFLVDEKIPCADEMEKLLKYDVKKENGLIQFLSP